MHLQLRHISVFVSLAIALVIGPGVPTASAQTDAGSLRVLLTDSSTAVVPGATVTVTNAGTGTAQTATSDGEGYVNFTPLPRGTYRLLASLDGFQSREVNGLTVDVNERKFVRMTLDAAGIAETVHVVASQRTLQTEEGSLGQVIRGTVATELPLA